MKIDSHNYSGRYRAAGTETRYSAASRRAAQKKRRAAHIVTKAQVLQILLFGAMMVVIFFIGLLLPLRPEKSQIENRKLTPFPAITWDSFWDGEFFKGVETWYADTFPFREGFISLNQKVTNLYGINKEQLIGGKIQSDEVPEVSDTTSDFISDNSAVDATDSSSVSSESSQTESSASSEQTSSNSSTGTESEIVSPGNNHGQVPEKINSVYLLGDTAFGLYGFSQSVSKNYADIVNTAADKLDGKAQVYSIIAPISYAINLDMETQEKLGLPNNADVIKYIYSNMNDKVKTVSIYGNLAAHSSEYLYFRTDHHWTALGAYRAYEVFCNVKGIEAHPLSYFDTMTFDGFLGTMYATCNSPQAMADNPDVVTAYLPRGASWLTAVGEDGEEFDWPIIADVSDWAANSKYNCFIASDQAFETIHNEHIADGSSVMVIKDSFGNAFVPFLVDHYEYVYVVDPRYYEGGLVETVQKYNVQDVIFMHNITTTGSDTLSEYVSDFVNR